MAQQLALDRQKLLRSEDALQVDTVDYPRRMVGERPSVVDRPTVNLLTCIVPKVPPSCLVNICLNISSFINARSSEEEVAQQGPMSSSVRKHG
jgi:hypothetical protein